MIFIMNIVLVLIVFSLVSCEKVFPASFERCRNEDNKCLIRMWNNYINMTGSMAIPQLNLPNLHRYFVEKMVIRTGGNGPLNIKIEFRNANITGLDKFVIEKIVGFPRDPKSMSKFVIIGRCPHAQLVGSYKATGKILLVPISGDGDADVSLYNVKFKIKAEIKPETVDGEEYITIPKVHLNYTSERNHYRLENLLQNKELSDSLNMLINENQDAINPELIQPLSKSLAEIFESIFGAVFKSHPYRSFFLEE